MLSEIKCDYRQYGKVRDSAPRLLVYALLDLGFRATIYYRLSHWCSQNGYTLAATILKNRNIRATGADISPEAIIGPGLRISHPTGIVIGRGSRIGRYATILPHVTIGELLSPRSGSNRAYPVIGNNVTLCAGCVVVGPIEVGDNCVVAANAVVRVNVPPDTIAAGVPAKLIERSLTNRAQ